MPSQNSILLACAVVGAALFAAFRGEPPPVVIEARGEPESFDPSGNDREGDVLPPNHPPIGAMGAMGAPEGVSPENGVPEKSEAPPVIVWKAPPKWVAVPNGSTMRLATYHVPAASGAPDEAELSVVRAGGSTEANLTRWVGQFTDGDAAKRSMKTVNGLVVSLLEVSGTYTGGGMGPQASPVPHRGWMLAGAVVETPEGAYFFKLTGPSATVRAARADFDALIKSLAPVSTVTTL